MFTSLHRTVLILTASFFFTTCNAQDFLDVSIPGLFSTSKVKLEYYEYVPEKWNGHVIVMSHGSTGGNLSAVKVSMKFVGISSLAKNSGFAFLVFNRKGRGKSEGDFTEETGKCDFGSLSREVAEATIQLRQVVKFAKEKFKVDKVVLMGHSRGGFLSSHFAGSYPAEVSAVVNLAGGWSTICEQKNGGFAKHHFESSAKAFKNQFWIYFDNDSYFSDSKFGDAKYKWFRETAETNNLKFHQFTDGGRPDGHQAPTYTPKEWGNAIFPLLVKSLAN